MKEERVFNVSTISSSFVTWLQEIPSAYLAPPAATQEPGRTKSPGAEREEAEGEFPRGLASPSLGL